MAVVDVWYSSLAALFHHKRYLGVVVIAVQEDNTCVKLLYADPALGRPHFRPGVISSMLRSQKLMGVSIPKQWNQARSLAE